MTLREKMIDATHAKFEREGYPLEVLEMVEKGLTIREAIFAYIRR